MNSSIRYQVIGARSEKYADYLDILGAIVGHVPKVGVHIETNRLPTILIDATEVIMNHLLPRCARESTDKDNDDDDADDKNNGIDSFFPVLGWICGNLSDGGVPLILGFDLLEVTNDNLKAFCASFGTTGSGKCMYRHNAFQVLTCPKTNENYSYHEQPHYFTWRT